RPCPRTWPRPWSGRPHCPNRRSRRAGAGRRRSPRWLPRGRLRPPRSHHPLTLATVLGAFAPLERLGLASRLLHAGEGVRGIGRHAVGRRVEALARPLLALDEALRLLGHELADSEARAHLALGLVVGQILGMAPPSPAGRHAR